MAQLPGTERHVVLVNGIEPNLRWRAFCGELLGFVEDEEAVRNRAAADVAERLDFQNALLHEQLVGFLDGPGRNGIGLVLLAARA